MSARREGLEQTTGWVRWVTYNFAWSTTQPSAVEGSDRQKYTTNNTGGLSNYVFQLIYITGQNAPKPDTDTKNLRHSQSQSDRTVWVSSDSSQTSWAVSNSGGTCGISWQWTSS